MREPHALLTRRILETFAVGVVVLLCDATAAGPWAIYTVEPIRDSLSTVASTVSENFAAKQRNSAQHGANLKWLKHPAFATSCKPVKTCAKTLP